MSLLDFTVETIGAQSRSRARSQQTEIGPSELGSCRKKVWLKLQGTEETNETSFLASWMGTAIHASLDEAVERLDPFSARYLREIEVERDGMRGHVDLFDLEAGEVIDWKTTTKNGLKRFPTAEQIWQVQVYGYLLSKTHEVKTVSLVCIPRDGSEKHIKTHTEPYDEAVALEALAWLADVEGREFAPEPERSARYFCIDYCEFFGACSGGK